MIRRIVLGSKEEARETAMNWQGKFIGLMMILVKVMEIHIFPYNHHYLSIFPCIRSKMWKTNMV